MVIKGQFVLFSARVDTVNKHPWLETAEENLADKEQTPLETQGSISVLMGAPTLC